MNEYILVNPSIKALQCNLENYNEVCKDLIKEGFRAHIVMDSRNRFEYVEVSTNDNKEIARPCYNNIYIFNYVIIIEHFDQETNKKFKTTTVLSEADFNKLFKKQSDPQLIAVYISKKQSDELIQILDYVKKYLNREITDVQLHKIRKEYIKKVKLNEAILISDIIDLLDCEKHND